MHFASPPRLIHPHGSHAQCATDDFIVKQYHRLPIIVLRQHIQQRQKMLGRACRQPRGIAPLVQIIGNAVKLALLQRGAAAGETDCYNLLAICHEHGQGTAQNCRQAVLWYRRAIRTGDASAVGNLADLLDKAGKARRAEDWYRRAANNGGDEKLAYAEFLLRQNPAPTPAVIRLLRQAAARDIHTSEDAQARAAEWLQRFQAA